MLEYVIACTVLVVVILQVAWLWRLYEAASEVHSRMRSIDRHIEQSLETLREIRKNQG